MSTFLRPLGFGEILDGAFTLYRRHFMVLFATGLVAMLPMALASTWWMRAALSAPVGDEAVIAGMLLFLPVSLALWTLLAAALTRQLAQGVIGGEVAIGDGYRQAIRRLPPLAGAFLLVMLVITGAVIAVTIVSMMIGAFVAITLAMMGAGGDGVAPIVLAVVGGMLMFGVMTAVMLFAMAVFFAVWPAVVVEGRGPVAALARSWRLANGARLRIVGILLIGWIIITLPTLGLTLMTGMTLGIYEPAAGAAPPLLALMAQQILGLVGWALTFPFYIGCLTLLYFDRRVRTEAYDVEAAADALPAAPAPAAG